VMAAAVVLDAWLLYAFFKRACISTTTSTNAS